MDHSIHSRPLSSQGRQNYDNIFRKTPAETPAEIVEDRRSNCCWEKVSSNSTHYVCSKCGQPCHSNLVRLK